MSNHMTGNSKHRLLKKQIFTLSAAFVFVISALTGSSYYANKRESEILAKNRTEMLASLSDGLGSSAASDTGTDSAASDEYINKVQTISANKGVVVFATSEPKKVKKLADDETTVTYGSLTLADFKTEKKAEKVIDSMKDSNVLMALGTTEFYIQGDPEETPAVDETVKGNGNSPLVALIDTGDNNADSSVNLTKDSDSDVNGHGTSMDAIIRKAANGNVRILSIKAMNDDGTGTLTNIAAAIRYAVDNGADIINMSIAAKADDNSRRVMQALVDEAAAKNIKVVAAAGNYGDSTSNYIPAGLSGVISVSAADNRGYLQKDVNSSAKIYIKEKTSTSSAAAEFTGYLANSESVKLSDHYDVLIDVKDNQHKSSSASDNSADSTFRTQETGWSLYMYWHDYHVENKNTGVPDEQKGLDPAHGDNPAKVVWNGFEINERTGGAKNDFNGWDNIHANKNGYNFNGFSDSPLYTTGRHKIYNARYNPHYGSSGYKSNGIHDAGSFYIHANSNSNAMSSGDWTWSGTKDLYPIWDAHEYRIRYNANGGSGYTPSMSVFYDYHGYVSSNNFSRPGYKFIGWNTRSDGNGRSWSEGQYIKGSFLYNALGDDDRYAPGYAGTYDLYAQWEPITRVDTSVNLHTGSTQNETMSDGTNSNDNDETMITFDVWKKATGSTTWSKIKSDVSSYGDSQKTGDVLIFSNIQVKPGYMWRNGVPGTLYNTTSIPTQYTASGEFPPTGENSDTGWIQANVTDKVEYKLVFDLQPAAYTVKFDKNSVKGQNGVPDYPEIELATGSMQDEAMQYGVSKALTKNAYTWRGHTFAGWNTQPDGSGTSYKDQQSGCLDMTKEDGSTVTLYAQWKPDSATVYLDPNGGTYTGDDGKEYTKKGEYSKTGTWGTPLELNDVKSATSDGTIKYDFNAKDASWADNQYSKVSASAINSNTDTTTFKLGGWKVYVDSDEAIEQTAGTGRSGFVVDSTANPGLFTYIYGDAVIGDDSASGTPTDNTISTSINITETAISTSCSNLALGNGGGIYVSDKGKLYLGYSNYVDATENTPAPWNKGIYYNHAHDSGGGLYFVYGNNVAINMNSGTISNNGAAKSGGAICVCGDGTLTLGGTTTIPAGEGEIKQSIAYSSAYPIIIADTLEKVTKGSIYLIPAYETNSSSNKLGYSSYKPLISLTDEASAAGITINDIKEKFIVEPFTDPLTGIVTNWTIGSDGKVAKCIENLTVSATGTYQSIAAAVATMNDASKDYVITLDGEITGPQTIEGLSGEEIKANSITIKGKASSSSNLSDIINASGGTGSALSINTGVPVTLSYIAIKGGCAVNGGGLFLGEGATAYLTNYTTIKENTNYSAGVNTEGKGGGVYISNDAKMIMNSVSTVCDNTGTRYGAGIYVEDGGYLRMLENSESHVSYNKFISGSDQVMGGGIYLEDGAVMEHEGGYIHDNEVNADGLATGVYVNSSAIYKTMRYARLTYQDDNVPNDIYLAGDAKIELLYAMYYANSYIRRITLQNYEENKELFTLASGVSSTITYMDYFDVTSQTLTGGQKQYWAIEKNTGKLIKSSGMGITVSIPSGNDIEVTVNVFKGELVTPLVEPGTHFTGGKKLQFIAPDDLDEYTWKVDGIEESTGYILTVDTESWSVGNYVVYLEAQDDDGNYYSYTAQIKVGE